MPRISTNARRQRPTVSGLSAFFTKKKWRFLSVRGVHALTIMFLPVNGPAGAIFLAAQVATLYARHLAIGFDFDFVRGNLAFALFEPGSLPGSQLAGSHALINTLLLIDLALVYPGRSQRLHGNRGGLGKRRATERDGNGYNQGLNLHDVFLS